MSLFRGSGVAIVTPFKDNEIDYLRLENLIEWQIEQGSDAIIITGTTGESAALTYDEKKALYKFTVEIVNKRVPIIAATGTNNTQQALMLSQAASEVGVDGLLIVTPYYNKGNRSGLIQHYHYIADRVETPIILYNVPSRTGVNLDPELVAELAQHPRIIAIKAACGDISQIAETIRLAPKDFEVYAGNDDQVLPILSLGGVGVISAVANIIPADMHNCVMDHLEGRLAQAIKLQLNMLPLISAIFSEVNPVPVKAALALMGRIEHELRLPLARISDANMKRVHQEMLAYGLLNPVI